MISITNILFSSLGLLTFSLFYLSMGQISSVSNSKPKFEKREKETLSQGGLESTQLFDNWLGMTTAITDGKLEIIEIYPDGPAERMGLRLWDYLDKANGQKIKTSRDLNFIVNGVSPGTPILINYNRKSGNGSVTIKVEKRETIADMMGRQVKNKLGFELYSNNKPYELEFHAGNVKVLYFMANIDEALDQQAAYLAAEINASKFPGLAFFAITFMSCIKVTYKPFTGKYPIEQFCHERRLPENTTSPFEMYYDRQGIAFRTFRVEKKPSIVIVDSTNVVRFAGYANKDSIAKVIEIMRTLQRSGG